VFVFIPPFVFLPCFIPFFQALLKDCFCKCSSLNTQADGNIERQHPFLVTIIIILAAVLHVEAEWNNSAVALRVVVDIEKGIVCQGYNSSTLSLGDINIVTWLSRFGVGLNVDDL
jgi:hypothetical protein